MAKLWFKARRFGWGWTPVSVEGWIVSAVFALLMLAGAVVFIERLLAGGDPRVAALLFLLWTLLLVAALSAIAWAKGEKPGWRWG